MPHRFLIAALIALVLPAAAYAQAEGTPLSPLKGLWNRPDYDKIEATERIKENAARDLANLHMKTVAALNAKDYAAAETVGTDLLNRIPSTVDANFLMGLAKVGLEKWSEARTYLEAAVEKEPSRPEPRTRLGLTYLKLKNMDAAKKQRAELASLDAACNKSCLDATWIADGLHLLDQEISPPDLTTMSTGLVTAAVAPVDGAIAVTADFDPAKYSLVTFGDATDLYDLLTAPGRCAPHKLAEPRQPCALILYQPVSAADTGGLTANFKPVFRVDSRKSVWAIHDKQLQKVKIEDLYFDKEDIIGQKERRYASVAVVGNAENKANCDKGAPCLNDLVVQDMFRMYGKMPDSVVNVIWEPKMKDNGTVRIR